MRALSTSRTLGCALLVALCASVSGCYSKATGYQGKFTFAYSTDLVELENFVKPIAPGAKLDMVAFANGTENELTITGAKSLQPGILAVDSIAERRVTVKGVAPGFAEIEITARDPAGNTLVDKMFLHVAKPAKHPLDHSCTEERDAAYVVGDPIYVFHGLATSDQRPVIGYGFAPVRIEPASALELTAQPQAASVYVYRATKANARIKVSSTVDDSELTMRVVERADLKEATVDCADGDCRMFEGGTRYVGAHVSYGDTPLCSQQALTKARSLTPDICTVSAKLEGDDGADSNREQLAVVEGLKYGVCKFEMTLPELAGGKGIRLTGSMKVGRMQFPGDGSASRSEPLLALRDLTLWNVGVMFWLAPKVLALAFMMWRRRRRESHESSAEVST